jgi:catechol 2,3-dioxygenase-like lactoylglutathione lyase family enzyme
VSLHRLSSITIGVPDGPPVTEYYEEFGLSPDGDASFSTVDGGRQLVVQEASTRRLIEMVLAADDEDDLGSIATALGEAGHHPDFEGKRLTVQEPHSDVRVVVEVAPRSTQVGLPPLGYNAPGHVERVAARSPAVLREDRVRPRKLGHVVITTPDYEATSRFFVEGIGFKVSDYIGAIGAFLRCSTDHHNLLVLAAPAPFLHHTAWQVDDVDEVGRGAFAMLEGHPERHVWGLGRHHAGSNFFWYLKDPAGNFSEYYADLDIIPENASWTPEDPPGRLGLYNWGPEPPMEFIAPDDVPNIVDRLGAVDT